MGAPRIVELDLEGSMSLVARRALSLRGMHSGDGEGRWASGQTR